MFGPGRPEAPPEPTAGRFYLLTGKVGQHTQFATQNNPLLTRVDYHTRDLWMYPSAARERGDVMAHTWREDGRWLLRGKITGEEYEIPMVQGSACEQTPDEQNSRYCHECHAYDRAAGMETLARAPTAAQ